MQDDLNKTSLDTSQVSRFEVIDDNGRSYGAACKNVRLSLQDDGRTLKVFFEGQLNEYISKRAAERLLYGK